jgi:endonuclease III
VPFFYNSAMSSHNPGIDCHKLLEVADRLKIHYGRLQLVPSHDGVGELVATILSQNTSDMNASRAYASLKSRFLDWTSIELSVIDDVAEAIVIGGLARQKARAIKSALTAIRHRFGTYDLLPLKALNVGEARSFLVALPGVGPKTASCVLLFALGMPAMPVDTHVHRVTRRIGIAMDKVGPAQIQEAIENCLGSEASAIYQLHMNLIRHGRVTCTSRNPKCSRCAVSDLCDYWKLANAAEGPVHPDR